MRLKVKLSDLPLAGEEQATISVTFGSVTVEGTVPPEHVRRANIEAGQAALRLAKRALIKPGINLPREKGVPLYFGCEDQPGLMLQELDGKKTLGRFVRGRFYAIKEADRLVPKGRRRRSLLSPR